MLRSPFFVALAFIFATCITDAHAATVTSPGQLTISNGDISPDGFTRAATLVNGQIDGPLITASKGDTLQMTVVNNINDTTMYQGVTVHWHGFFQNTTGWADGTSFVTQCPIVPGNSFTYTFDTTSQSGTFWYHSHHVTQYCDGLRGPLVVYDPDDPYLADYDVDDDTTIITLSDWYHTVSPDAGVVPTPDATLINGIGRSLSDTTADLAVISVEQGKRYRFRLVNMACDPNYIFSIDNHTMSVIEADAVNHQAQVVDSIQIYAGQRYSFILTANQSIGNYWIRAQPSKGAQTDFTNGLNSAILRYTTADDDEPTTPEVTLSLALNESTLVPLGDDPLGADLTAPGTAEQGGADDVFNIAITFDGTNFAINGEIFQSPSVPVLLQILSGAQDANSLLPSGSVFNINRGDVVEVTIPGGTAGAPHPFHLHGHEFYVVRSAGQTTANYVNPPRRDVVNTGTSSSDNVTIRFVADNPGPWIFHCHIDWHLGEGLAIVFAEIPDEWNSTITPSDDWENLCPLYDATTNTTSF